MAIPIRPKDLPAGTPIASADYIYDSGTQVLKAKAIDIVNAATPLASQAEAEAGIDNVNRITSLRVAQAINFRGYDAAIAARALSSSFSNGTYTPTLVSRENIAAVSVLGTCQYMRVGDVVTVSGCLEIDPTTSGVDTYLNMMLPIPSNIGAIGDLGGASACVQLQQSCSVYGDSTAKAAIFRYVPVSAAPAYFPFSFTYRII